MSRTFARLWVLGAVLTGITFGLLSSLPSPPSDPAAVAGWVDAGQTQLTWSGELLFFAVVTWGAGTAGLLHAGLDSGLNPGLNPGRKRKLLLRHCIACAGMGVTLIALVIVLLALGRLVYPIIDVSPTVDTLALVISLAYGAQHLALLGLAVTAISLPLLDRAARTRWATNSAGVIVGIIFVAGSYPWATPTWVNVAVSVLVALWGAVTGKNQSNPRRLVG